MFFRAFAYLLCLLCVLPPRLCSPPDRKCRRFPNLPETKEEFAKIREAGEPVIFENGASVYGPTVQSFADLGAFRKVFGDVTGHGDRYSCFDKPGQGKTTARGDGVQYFGMVPVENGTRLWYQDAWNTSFNKMQAAIDRNTSEVWTLEQFPIYELASQIDDDDAFPSQDFKSDVVKLPDWWSEDLTVHFANLWANVDANCGRPKESCLHYDDWDNLSLQIIGRKKFITYGLSEVGKLYHNLMVKRVPPHPHDLQSFAKDRFDLEGFHNFSPVDPLKPDFERFPLFEKAVPITCEVEAGNVLYMPAFTFHHVLNWVDESSKANLGINFWFLEQTMEAEELNQHTKERMRALAYNNSAEEVKKWVDRGELKSDETLEDNIFVNEEL
eukprot:TRINITY_DN4432_c0_g1_i9.p1 TRINITY_DN4432_c0_g1~~TRINITY_DN4432_c0_g1_i9.p1  ORF type:complete len:384 (-),score=48.36 TRINITY_DN4432_c0_g1_i9:85-1236(-)